MRSAQHFSHQVQSHASLNIISSAQIRRHMEAVAAAEVLLLGKRALRRRPKDLDSITSPSLVRECCICYSCSGVSVNVCNAVGRQRSHGGGNSCVSGSQSDENCDRIAGVCGCRVRPRMSLRLSTTFQLCSCIFMNFVI